MEKDKKNNIATQIEGDIKAFPKKKAPANFLASVKQRIEKEDSTGSAKNINRKAFSWLINPAVLGSIFSVLGVVLLFQWFVVHEKESGRFLAKNMQEPNQQVAELKLGKNNSEDTESSAKSLLNVSALARKKTANKNSKKDSEISQKPVIASAGSNVDETPLKPMIVLAFHSENKPIVSKAAAKKSLAISKNTSEFFKGRIKTEAPYADESESESVEKSKGENDPIKTNLPMKLSNLVTSYGGVVHELKHSGEQATNHMMFSLPGKSYQSFIKNLEKIHALDFLSTKSKVSHTNDLMIKLFFQK